MNNKTIFKNDYVSVEENKDDISFFDLTDKYNDFKGFTRNKRSLNKAVEFFGVLSKDERLRYDIKMFDVVTILEKFKLKPRTYCGMD